MDRTTPSDDALPRSDGGARARAARVLCCITFHFVHGRLESLAEVLQALSEFPVAFLEVVIVANAIGEGDDAILRRLAAEIMGEGRATIRRVEGLEHPFDLAWHHKQVLAERFPGDAVSGFTHFIYLEDDIGFTFANFEYFVAAREHLRGAGLLPAYLRAEWSQGAAGLVATDCFWPVYVPAQPRLGAGELLFINMPNPYNPCFVLDRELAHEHLASPASDRLASSRLVAWGIRERAAMGLCLDNVPKPFHWRYVVPLSTVSDSVPSWARVRHLQGTYAAANTGLAKTRLESLFRGARVVAGSAWWPRTAEPDGSPRFFLVTHHDTIVHFDWTVMALRHGPLGVAPLNLTAELVEGEAVLAAADGEGRTHRVAFHAEATGEHCVGLKHDNRYASADGGGLVRVNRSVLSDWETFGLMRCDTVSGIGLLAEHSWKDDADHGIVRLEAQPIVFWPWQASPASALAAGIVRNMPAAPTGISFGPARIRLVTRKPQLEFAFEEVDGRRRPTRVSIVEDGGAVFSFSRVANHREADGNARDLPHGGPGNISVFENAERSGHDRSRKVAAMTGADEMSLRMRGNFRRSLYGAALESSLTSALELNHKIPDWIRAMPGMSGRKYRYFINRLVESVADARYLEVGSWMGSSVCSAIWGNEATATCIDNWSEFGGPKQDFLKHVDLALNPQVQFKAIERDFRQVDWSMIGKANIYFFDGPHSESDQYDGIVLAQPALDTSYVLVVDDFNWPAVRNGTARAINDLALLVECSIEIRSTQNDLHPPYEQSGSSSDWHNGYFIAVVNKASSP